MNAMGNIGAALRDRMESADVARFSVRKIAAVWHMSYGDERGAARAAGLTPQEAARKLSERLAL